MFRTASSYLIMAARSLRAGLPLCATTRPYWPPIWVRTTMLEVRDLRAAYNGKEALHGLSFEVTQGDCVCLIGANGAGKTTTMRCLSGLLRPTYGTITFAGADITTLSPAVRVAAGIALVPEGRRVFAPLTVQENLEMGAYRRLWPRRQSTVAADFDFVFELFPRLLERSSQAAGAL